MDKEITTKLQEILHKCQAWVDDEKYVPKKFRAKSWSDEFAEKIMRELDDEMIKQKFGRHNDKIYLPTRYSVQISQEDSSEFVGRKRELLVELLNKFVGNCLRLLSIETNVSDFVQLYASAELQSGEIKVAHYWEESYSPLIWFNQNAQTQNVSEDTIIAPAFWKNDFEKFDNDYETVVNKNLKRLFCLDISQNGISRSLPIFQTEIIIGRGSSSLPVDVILNDDLEISRHHAVLDYQTNDLFSLFVVGQNPALVDGNFIFPGQMATLNWDENFQIGSYELKMQR